MLSLNSNTEGIPKLPMEMVHDTCVSVNMNETVSETTIV
jgi:hypothetical protein